MTYSIQSGFGILKPFVCKVGLRRLWHRSRWTTLIQESNRRKGAFSNWSPLVLAWKRRLKLIDQTMNILKSIVSTYLYRLHVYTNMSFSHQDRRPAAIFSSNTNTQGNHFLREHAQTASVAPKPEMAMDLIFESRIVRNKHSAIGWKWHSNTRLHRQSNYFSKVQFLHTTHQKQLTQLSCAISTNISPSKTYRTSEPRTAHNQSLNLAFPVLNTTNAGTLKVYPQQGSERGRLQTASVAPKPEMAMDLIFESRIIRNKYSAIGWKWHSNTRLHRQSNYFSKVQFLHTTHQKQLTQLSCANSTNISPSKMHRTSEPRTAHNQSLNLAFPVLNTTNAGTLKFYPQQGSERERPQTASVAPKPEIAMDLVFESCIVHNKHAAIGRKWISNTRLHRRSNDFSKIQFLHSTHQRQMTQLFCVNSTDVSLPIKHRTPVPRMARYQSFNFVFPVLNRTSSGTTHSNYRHAPSQQFVWRNANEQVFRDKQSGRVGSPSTTTNSAQHSTAVHKNDATIFSGGKETAVQPISKNSVSSIDLPLLDKVAEDVIRRVERRVRIERERKGL